MKNPKITDPFIPGNVLKGIALMLIDSRSTVHDYMHTLTFKTEFKEYEEELAHPRFTICIGIDFCRQVQTPIVRHGCSLYNQFTKVLVAFCKENGFFEHEILSSDIANYELLRYYPKSEKTSLEKLTYKELAISYHSYLKRMLKSFYYFACAFTIGGHQIPHIIKTNIHYTINDNFIYLNQNHHEVANLIQWIKAMQLEIAKLKRLIDQINDY